MKDMTDIELWTKAISRYPDDSFFFIIKNYLGNISTPFHKPELIERLTRFFVSPTIQKRIFSLIDAEDCLVLSAVALMGSPTKEEIHHLLRKDMEYVALHKKMVNLEERLLIVPDSENASTHLILNPLMEKELRTYFISFFPLLGQAALPLKTHTAPTERTALSSEYLKAVLNLLLSGRLTYDSGRKGMAPLHDLFPQWTQERIEQFMKIFLPAIEASGIITLPPEGAVTSSQRKQLSALFSLTPLQFTGLMLTWILVAVLMPAAEKNMEGLHVESIHLLQILSRIPHITADGLSKIILIVYRSLPHTAWTGISLKSFMEILTTTGVLHRMDSLFIINPDITEMCRIPDGTDSATKDFSLLVDSDGILSYRYAPQAPSHFLFLYAEVSRVDTYVQYEMTRSSFKRARDMGLTLTEITSTLHQMVKDELPRFLIDKIAGWEEAYNEVRIYEGITLACSERLSRIVEHLPALSHHILAKIAPGIYLMDYNTENQWRKIIEDAGVDMLPAPARIPGGGQHRITLPSGDSRKDRYMVPVLHEHHHPLEKVPMEAPDYQSEDDFISRLQEKIQELQLHDDSYEEMLNRLNSKLILDASQIIKGNKVYIGLQSASGFDYQGKILLCKSAAGNPSVVLEIQMGGETEETVVVQVLEILDATKKNALLKARIMPDGIERIIPVSSIFYVRRERFSLF